MVTWRTVLLVNLIVIAGIAMIYFGVGHGPRQEWLACEQLFATAATQQDSLIIDRTVAHSARRREPSPGPPATCGELRRLHGEQAARR